MGDIQRGTRGTTDVMLCNIDAKADSKSDRDAVDFLRDDVVAALTQSLKMTPQSAGTWFDSARADHKINIEGFAKIVYNYLATKSAAILRRATAPLRRYAHSPRLGRWCEDQLRQVWRFAGQCEGRYGWGGR